jgi:CRISPR-associated exonuclease Cas4
MLSITGTLIWYYYICQREVWLMAHQLMPSQENPFIELGRLIDKESLKREKKQIHLENVVLDIIDQKDGKLVVGEVKKSSKAAESARMQLAFYLLKLQENGIEAKGELIFPKEKKREKVVLTQEIKDRLYKACGEIEKIVSQELPPKAVKIGFCKNCGYKEMCWV